MDAQPVISVVVATRDRSASVGKTIESILLNDPAPLELIVVDQSEGGQTAESVRPFLNDRRLVYLRTTGGGVASGRNVGISRAQGELIALTDDDCAAPRNWVHALAEAFAVDRRIGIVFGNVLAGEHDRDAGFIPAYVRSDSCLATTIHERHKVNGIGACMAVRRSVWRALDGFDEALGAGSDFRSAEDWDFAIRALLAGHAIFETPAVYVVHNGFRPWDWAATTVGDYLYGIGAASIKHLKCGHWRTLGFLRRLGWRWAFQNPIVDLGRRPPRGLRLKAFTRGCLAGARRPVDRREHYVRWPTTPRSTTDVAPMVGSADRPRG